jgi:multidrug efflux pump subunit AcrA (membrane-fusion protein)
MNRRILGILKAVAGAAVLIAVVAWLSGGCGDRIGPDDTLPGAHAGRHSGASASVQEERAEIFEVASGTVSSARHTTISSKILARIDSIPVRAGDQVEAGALVVRLDNRALDARLRAAREAVIGAEAAESLARSEIERITELHRSRVASQRQLDRASTDHRMAESELEGARQGLADAEVALSYSEIQSPVSGRVIDRLCVGLLAQGRLKFGCAGGQGVALLRQGLDLVAQFAVALIGRLGCRGLVLVATLEIGPRLIKGL